MFMDFLTNCPPYHPTPSVFLSQYGDRTYLKILPPLHSHHHLPSSLYQQLPSVGETAAISLLTPSYLMGKGLEICLV